MKHLSLKLLAETVTSKRKALGLSQTALSEKTGISRTMFTRLEQENYSPSVDQLLCLSEILEFDYRDLLVDDTVEVKPVERKRYIPEIFSAETNLLRFGQHTVLTII